MQNWKKNLLSGGMAVIACLLVVMFGLLVWQLTGEQRRVMAQGYLANSENYLKQNDSQALWELTKAYVLDLSYSDYRIKQAKMFYSLSDARAEEELKEVIGNGWADDEIYFDYAQIMLAKGLDSEAVKYLKKVSAGADEKLKNQVLLDLVKLAGDQGKWEEAVGFRQQLSELDKNNIERLRYEAALAIVTADIDDGLKAKLEKIMGVSFSEERWEVLQKVNGDSYVVQAADWLLDLELPRWGRNYLQQLGQTSLEVIDVYLLYAKSYWLEGKEALAVDYVDRAYQIDSTNKSVRYWLELIDSGCDS